jgi:signal transduction histidine kinase/ligand-binding sensor domain-containing protein
LAPFAFVDRVLIAARLCLVAAPAILTVQGEQLPTAVFSARDGLHTTVETIVVDSKGFVWLPGEAGLARYDGNGFRIFTVADGLPPGVPQDIFEREDGTYWVAVHEHICLFDPRPADRRFQCESPQLGPVHVVVEDERGVWCGTDTGLWRRPPGDANRWEPGGPIEPAARDRSRVVHRILKDTRGDLWITASSGLYRIRRQGPVERWTVADGIEPDTTTSLSEADGSIWVGSQFEMARLALDPLTGDARIADRHDRSHGLPSRYVTNVRSWRGSVWAATFQGLARRLPSGGWQPVELPASLMGVPLATLAIDSAGNLWIGTDGGGAARISDSGFSTFNDRDGLEIQKVWAVFEDRGGDLIAVTKDESHYSLSRFDGFRFHPLAFEKPNEIAFGWSWAHIAVHSQSGEWWLGTGLGILHYKSGLNASPALLEHDVGLPAGNTRVFEDSHGVIWAGLRAVSNNGLYSRKPGALRFERWDESHGLPPLDQDQNSPAVFAEDRIGQVWIGMLNGGLVRLRDGKFQQFASSEGAPSRGVRALLVDREGRLWVGTRREGLLRVDDPASTTPVFRTIALTGRASTAVVALAEDLTGRIYAATGGGIERLDPGTGRVRQFSSADGLPPAEYRVATRDRHGALWFGSDQGLVRLRPRPDSSDPPRVLIFSVRVNGEERLPSDFGEPEPAELFLGPSERQVQVGYGGFRHDLLYQKRLSGLDPDWALPSRSVDASYPWLAPGSYELAIRAMTPEGVAGAPARVRFTIAPPFWERWWVRLTIAAAALSLLFFWHRAQLERHLEIERVRSRIATDLHDDIGASLSRIAMMTEAIKARPDAPNADSNRTLGEIADTARGLVEDMSDIVWSIDPRRDTVGDLVARLRAFGFGLLEPRGVLWTFDAPEEMLRRRLGSDQRRQLYLIFKEALHNIARHSQARHATLRIGLEDHGLWAEIDDDGRGLLPGSPMGLGIRNMRERAAQLGGDLEVGTRPAGGVRVSLRIPLNAKDA